MPAFDLLALGAQRRQLALGIVGLLAGCLRGTACRGEALRELQALRLRLVLGLLGGAGLRLEIGALSLLGLQKAPELVEHARACQDAILAPRVAGRADENLAGRPDDLAGLRHEPRAVLVARLGGKRLVQRTAYDDVAQKLLDGAGSLGGIRERVDQGAPAASAGGIARDDPGRASRARHEDDLAGLIGIGDRRRKREGVAGAVDEQRGDIRREQALDQLFGALLDAQRMRERRGRSGSVGMVEHPRAGGARRGGGALALLQALDLRRRHRDGVARGIERLACRLACADGRARLLAGLLLGGFQPRKLGGGGSGRGGLLRGLSGRALELHVELLAARLDELRVRHAGGELLARALQIAPRLLARGLGAAAVLLERRDVGVRLAVLARQRGMLLGEARDVGVRRLLLDAHLLQLGGGLDAVLLGLRAARLVRLERHLQIGRVALGRAALLVQKQRRGVEALDRGRSASVLARELARVHRLATDALLDALGVLLGLIDRRLALLELLLERALLLERLVPSALERAQVVHRERDRHVGELGGELLVSAGALCLARERPQLALHLGGDVLHAREMLVHALELARAFRLALLVLEHARRLLDERAAVLGLGLQDGIQVALADDGMRAGAQTGVVQDVEDVHAAGGGAVDQVLALARAVHAARDGDLGVVDGQRAVGVVEHEVDLGEPDAFARRRSGEDDVLHRLAAQVLGVALAEHPQNGVGDVRFA